VVGSPEKLKVVILLVGTLRVNELTPMGMAELLTGVEVAPTGGKTTPGVEQMVVVVVKTVVDVSRTVAPAGQSMGFVHNDVWTKVEVTSTTAVVVEATSRRSPVRILEELDASV
jgi:hypothetical protein